VRAAKYYLKSRDFHGTVTVRSMMGQRTIAQWTKWITILTFEHGKDAFDAMAKRRPKGAQELAVFHRGKRISYAEEKSL
jgi:hypothetical protein